MNCKNCDEVVTGKFCSNCGQSAKISRINWRNFINQVTESVFLVNKGFFYTLFKLFTKPGQSIRNYLDGKRKGFYQPIAYVLVLSTFYFLLSQLSDKNTLLTNILSGFFFDEAKNDTRIVSYLSWVSDHHAYITLLLIPVFSLASFVAFIGHQVNYLEHLVLNAYVTGQQAIIYALLLPFPEIIPTIIATIYTAWVYWQLFKNGNRAVNVLKTILTYLIYFILSFGTLGVISNWFFL
ncbi:DUF3667 domain-containing protein [Marinoscillum pacificum]|uniref:DUF3667 domain-containing protein n=1 Tax=Marinoscillum pacificum TaxID=392723 RepID=UPI0021581455|nr:DUF3667 domain-containing protein [Marinoscillum pacificum]